MKLPHILTIFICLTCNVMASDKSPIRDYNVSYKDGSYFNKQTGTYRRLSLTPAYKAIYDIRIAPDKVKCDDSGIAGDFRVVTMPKGSYFRETGNEGARQDGSLIIHVYQVPDSIGTQETVEADFFSGPMRLCSMGDLAAVENSDYRRVGGLATGVLVVPYKLRSGDLYSDATIGPYLAYQYESFQWLFTAGVTQISVNDRETDDVETKTGITFATGWRFNVKKNWDVGVLTGIDHLSGSTGDAWKYQDKWWLAVAIGYNFSGGPR